MSGFVCGANVCTFFLLKSMYVTTFTAIPEAMTPRGTFAQAKLKHWIV